VVLRGKNVARCPADVRAQGVQGFDEHGGLNGHVQRARDLEALEGLGGAVFFDAFHQTGHFALRKLHFLFAKVGKGHVGHFVGERELKRLGHTVLLIGDFVVVCAARVP